MITFIELWNVKQAWLDLPKEEKEKYITSLGPVIQQLLDSGVQIISWGINEPSTYSKIAYDYFAVWTFPNIEASIKFEQMVVDAGWYKYFEQVNAKGTSTSPQEVLGKIIDL